MLETLQPGQTWNQYGFFKTITTSEAQKDYINKVMRGQSYDIIEPFISDVFKKRNLPPLPIIGIHSREQEDTINLIKTFYLRFPQYRWFTFRDLRGLSQEEFANAISECFVSVWIDRQSAYGTFPLESMKVGVPVIGITPNLVPEWMNENNGIWIKDEILLSDIIADWTQNWLEDNISEEMYTNMKETVDKLPTKEQFENKTIELFTEYLELRAQSMEEQISKFND
jgi:glycosyltransferase involved in cell wall biosynthesis